MNKNNTHFWNIKKAIKCHELEQIERFRCVLDGLTVEKLLDSLCKMLSARQLETLKGMQGSEAVPEKIVRSLIIKRARQEARSAANRLALVEKVSKADYCGDVNICVEWKKSRTWGSNPTATVSGWNDHTTGTASGCGYDKESEAISRALNSSPECLRILWQVAERGGKYPYGVSVWGGVPAFAGGCGVSCFYSIFESCGYEFKTVACGKSFTVYRVEVVADK